MICRGCNKDKKLVKAHIIPESFFKGLRGEKEPAKIISNRKDFHPKRSPIGIYDTEILCKECELIFQDCDDYGHSLLIKNESSLEKLINNGKLVGYRADNINYDLLKLFFISILWRASISNHYFYKNIQLGKIEERAKQLIWAKDPGNKHDFSFMLGKFDDDDVGRTILNPHTERWFNIRYYRFYMYGYVLYIKSDSQPTPTEWAKFIPNNGSIIIISRGIMESSKEYPLLVKAAKIHAKT